MSQTPLLELDAALAHLLASVPRIDDVETVAIEGALDRITARATVAPVDVPPFAASAMDGYAVCSTDACFSGAPPYRVPVHGQSIAGVPWNDALRADGAIRIFTGAALPARADSVLLQERVTRDGGHIALAEPPTAGAWCRPRGHDVKAGAELLPRGTRLRAFEIGSLATCGISRVDVTRPVRVALFSTGNELREPGDRLAPGQIFESNRRVLAALLHRAPVNVIDLGILPDDQAAIADALRRAAARADVVLTSGGVSVGDADHVKAALEAVGKLEFWRLALKPGKPLAYGRIDDALFFGLPGNPVSTIVTFLMVVLPLIRHLAGAVPAAAFTVSARVTVAVAHDPGRAELQRGVLVEGPRGAEVTPTGDQASNRLQSFTRANCFIHIPSASGDLAAGDRVDVLPFEGLLY